MRVRVGQWQQPGATTKRSYRASGLGSRPRLGVLLLALTLAAGSGATPAFGAEDSPPLKYRVRFSGIDGADLRRDLKGASRMLALKKHPPASELQLRRRAERDLPSFDQVLRAHGYYGATVALDLNLTRRPVRVKYRVAAGERYRLRDVRLRVGKEPQSMASTPMPMPELPGLAAGAPAASRGILDGETDLIRYFQHRGYPLARVVTREVEVHHDAHAVDVRFDIATGPFARFGETTFSGAGTVNESFLRRKLPWKPGDVFDDDLQQLARRRYAEAGLFASVRVDRDAPAFAAVTEAGADEAGADAGSDGDPRVPMRVTLTERKQRSFTIAGGYHNDQGWRGRVGWERRNLFGRGQRLGVSYNVSEIGQGGELTLWCPDVRRVDQNLTLTLHQTDEDTDAYSSRNAGVLARLERPVGRGCVFSVGSGYRYSYVEDLEGREAFGLIYFPVGLVQDRSDNPLDPQRGYRASIDTAPYWDSMDGTLAFLKTRTSLALYHPLMRRWNLDWAGRLGLGYLHGQSRDAIPADERFYAGGGGSVRGYAYQSVGPLSGTTPLGGASQLLVANELRWRVTKTVGAVIFCDGGSVAESAGIDSAASELLWGAGGGLRYFTPFGPLRFDVGAPLNRRAGVDARQQFYISLGQAF